VRARGGNGGWVYTHTIKTPYASGASIERERIITRFEYDDLLVRRDVTARPIYKDRWCFTYGEHYCELDVFHGHLAGDVVLEIEHDEGEDVVTPPFLGPMTDVTDDPTWSNYRKAKAA
jgi:CYTH domain-containing protein